MKLDVMVGEVAVQNIVVRVHWADIMTVSIRTPFERHPSVNIGTTVGSGNGPASIVLNLYRGSQAGRCDYNPSRVVLTPETDLEEAVLMGGVFEIDWERWAVTVLCFKPELLAEGKVLASWERYEKGKVEYLGGL